MKVFIADDSLSVRELLVELLAELPGIEVVGQTADALEATVSIRSLKPDVVILDLRLLRGSGLGVLGTMKKEMPSLIVMILSGLPNPAYRESCLNLGADYVFRKSDGLHDLVKVLGDLAARNTSS